MNEHEKYPYIKAYGITDGEMRELENAIYEATDDYQKFWIEEMMMRFFIVGYDVGRRSKR